MCANSGLSIDHKKYILSAFRLLVPSWNNNNALETWNHFRCELLVETLIPEVWSLAFNINWLTLDMPSVFFQSAYLSE